MTISATTKALRVAFGSAFTVAALAAVLTGCDSSSSTAIESGDGGTSVVTGEGGDAIYTDPDGSISFAGTSPDGSDISFSTG